MPVAFSRLRIAGFKSFAEPVTVEILPGVTGIVGPNGCGKSNVVEALRWAMGETSARSLRGGEMDDVIFSGTANRPSRNIAEVTLSLEETAGIVPPPFHQHPELEVSRRIERGMGSTFRVNGQEVRARDVQTLFADLATGAHSSAMVSQGSVSAVVSARPESRRMILEEAAGITGLHARRHEAELKLRQAELNLSRAEDLRGQREVQLQGLKRQARQASRYRNISGAIRGAEAEFLAIQRAGVEAVRAAAAAALHEAGLAVAAATERATAASARAAETAAALPPLHEAEADARTALERDRIAQEQLAAEVERAQVALAAATERLAQLGRDLTHAEQLGADARAAEERLAAEASALEEAERDYAVRAEAAGQEAAEAMEVVRSAEREANAATDAAAEASARSQAVAALHAAAAERVRRASEAASRAAAEQERIAAEAVEPARLEAAGAERQAAAEELAVAREALERAENARAVAHTELVAARDRETEATSAHAKLAAEAAALAEVLAVKDGETWPPMVDALSVPAGLEPALGAALGEELTSAADQNAARHWRELSPLDPPPALPAGARPLAQDVAGPAALARALSQIGLVADDETGDALQPELAPGQVLVSRAGAVWRWDGYTIRAGAPTAAAVRLQQRNRLSELDAVLGAAAGEAEGARAARAAAEAAEKEAVVDEQRHRALCREAEQRLERAQAALAALTAQAAANTAKLMAVEAEVERLAAEREEAEKQLARAEAARAALPDLAVLRQAVDEARAALSAARNRETVARSTRDTIAREHEARSARRERIAVERADWRSRAEDAAGRLADLGARHHEAEAEQKELEAAPGRIAARRAEALDQLQRAEAAHRHAADMLQQASGEATAAERAARAAEAALAAAREATVRAEGNLAQAEQAASVVAERIVERLGPDPALPDPPAELSPEVEERARKRLERLLREREEMGPVNLRADIEADEVEKQIAAITAERDELSAAIAKLRGSIGHLNREGRERLGVVFQQVDRHFQALFARLFGGGRAHLALVGSDDPLEAGLEIYAQPPGKKLATLSLLSGGEQALTALSLIFAVFLCNPAPICVLDEVDAPLDDPNVERFCDLLDDMARESGTRFLVVTHHHLTMARMDRLYGVTMQERGVSRLLSVDLQAAAAMSMAAE